MEHGGKVTLRSTSSLGLDFYSNVRRSSSQEEEKKEREKWNWTHLSSHIYFRHVNKPCPQFGHSVAPGHVQYFVFSLRGRHFSPLFCFFPLSLGLMEWVRHRATPASPAAPPRLLHSHCDSECEDLSSNQTHTHTH